MRQSVKALVSLEFRSTPSAFEYVNSLDDGNNVLELVTHSSGATIVLMECSSAPEIKIKKQLIDYCVIETPHPSLLKFYFGLMKTEFKGALGLVECATLSKALNLAQEILQISGNELIEIDSGRGASGKSMVYFTGTAESLKKTSTMLKKQKDKRLLSFSLLPNTNSTVRQYFQLE